MAVIGHADLRWGRCDVKSTNLLGNVIALEHAWFELLTVLPALAALAVTIHALLRKREVTTAAGWIALAWLSPLVGSVLYFVFGINRVRKHTR